MSEKGTAIPAFVRNESKTLHKCLRTLPRTKKLDTNPLLKSIQFLGSGMAVEFRLPMFNYGKRKEIKYLPGSTWKKGWVIQVLILPLSKILNRPKFDELWEFHKQNELS